jgi:hypothetical protein
MKEKKNRPEQTRIQSSAAAEKNEDIQLALRLV